MPNTAAETLDEVFLGQRTMLIRVLTRIVGSRATAEDLAHEAYLRVSAAMRERAVENVQPFLYQTARNLALDHLRAEGRRRTVIARDVGESVLAEVACDRPSPEAETRDRQLVAQLQRRLAGLTPRQREVLLLARVHGRTYDEIARRLGVSASTVQKDLKTALEACLETFVRLGIF